MKRGTVSVQKVMFAAFTICGPAIEVVVPKGKSVTALFYRDKVLKKKLQSCFQRHWPKNGQVC